MLKRFTGLLGDILAFGEQVAACVADEDPEHVLLRGVMSVDSLSGDANLGTNFIQGHRCEAALGKESSRCLEELFTAFLFFDLTPRFHRLVNRNFPTPRQM